MTQTQRDTSVFTHPVCHNPCGYKGELGVSWGCWLSSRLSQTPTSPRRCAQEDTRPTRQWYTGTL